MNICFEAIQNDGKSESSVIKFLVSEKCEVFGIYRRMSYVTKNHVWLKNMLLN